MAVLNKVIDESASWANIEAPPVAIMTPEKKGFGIEIPKVVNGTVFRKKKTKAKKTKAKRKTKGCGCK